MKKFKKIIDERQELELLKIYRMGFWVLFWGLFAIVQVQLFFLGSPKEILTQVAGEMIVLVIGAIFVVIGSVRKGIWDERFKPDKKTNFLLSLGASVVMGAFVAVRGKIMYPDMMVISALLTWLVTAVSMFIACFVLLSIAAAFTNRKKAKLEEEFTDEES